MLSRSGSRQHIGSESAIQFEMHRYMYLKNASIDICIYIYTLSVARDTATAVGGLSAGMKSRAS